MLREELELLVEKKFTETPLELQSDATIYDLNQLLRANLAQLLTDVSMRLIKGGLNIAYATTSFWSYGNQNEVGAESFQHRDRENWMPYIPTVGTEDGYREYARLLALMTASSDMRPFHKFSFTNYLSQGEITAPPWLVEVEFEKDGIADRDEKNVLIINLASLRKVLSSDKVKTPAISDFLWKKVRGKSEEVNGLFAYSDMQKSEFEEISKYAKRATMAPKLRTNLDTTKYAEAAKELILLNDLYNEHLYPIEKELTHKLGLGDDWKTRLGDAQQDFFRFLFCYAFLPSIGRIYAVPVLTRQENRLTKGCGCMIIGIANNSLPLTREELIPLATSINITYQKLEALDYSFSRSQRAKAEELASLLPKWAHNMRGPTSVLVSRVDELVRVISTAKESVSSSSLEADIRSIRGVAEEIDNKCELLKVVGEYIRNPSIIKGFLSKTRNKKNACPLNNVVNNAIYTTLERILFDRRDKAGVICEKIFAENVLYGIPADWRWRKSRPTQATVIKWNRFDRKDDKATFTGLMNPSILKDAVYDAFDIKNEKSFNKLKFAYERNDLNAKLNACAASSSCLELFETIISTSGSLLDLKGISSAHIASGYIPDRNMRMEAEDLIGDHSVSSVFRDAFEFIIEELLWNALYHCKPINGQERGHIEIDMGYNQRADSDFLPGVSCYEFRISINNTAPPSKENINTGQGIAFVRLMVISAFRGKYVYQTPSVIDPWFRVDISLPTLPF